MLYCKAMAAEKDLVRLDKVLANNGYGTRKEVKRLIHRRCVTVNGTPVTDADAHISLATDSLAVDGSPVLLQAHCHVMMNKPADTVCSTKGNGGTTVYELLDERFTRPFSGGTLATVGRLDRDTEGLLLFTTDGDLNHRLTAPKRRIPKIYLVCLRDAVDERQRTRYVQRLSAGMHIPAEDRAEAADCLPAELEWREEAVPAAPAYKAVCRLTVYEGKYHEVKRLFAALGNELVYLRRLAINGLWLDESLPPGGCRELTAEELRLLQEVRI